MIARLPLLLAAPVLLAGAQDRHQVFKPNTVIDGGRVQPSPKSGLPRGTLAGSYDEKAWITSINGRHSGLRFGLNSELVVRGKGLANPVGAWIITSRRVAVNGRIPNAGSMLSVIRRSDTELVLRVTGTSGGTVPWSRSGSGQGTTYRFILRLDGGARQITAALRDSRYECTVGEPNCAP